MNLLITLSNLEIQSPALMSRILLYSFIFCLITVTGFTQVPKGQVMFISGGNDKDYHYNLFLINSDGTNERQLTQTNKLYTAHVINNKIVYTQKEDNGKEYSMFITGVNGSPVKPLIKHKVVCNPRWKPDGKLIAYENYPADRQEIWVMDSNGANKHLLISNARHPYWSTDITKMVFTRNHEVYMHDLIKGTDRQLTHWTAKSIAAKWPAISPDNKKVAFVGDSNGKSSMYILDLKNGSQKIIEHCSTPYWTDNPKYLVCSYYDPKSGHYQIVMINVDTEEKIFITNNKRRNDQPVWLTVSGH